MKTICTILMVLSGGMMALGQPLPPEIIWSIATSLGSFGNGESIIQTNDEGFLVTGSISIASTYSDLFVAKLDQNGNKEYFQTYGGTGSQGGMCIYPTYDDKYIIGGYNNGDMWLLELDAEYQLVWSATIGWNMSEYIGDLKYIPGEGYIIIGTTTSFGAGSYDLLLVKTDLMGNLLWFRTFGGNGQDYGSGIDITNDGGFIITGKKTIPTTLNIDLWLIRTDSLGNEIWQAQFGGEYYESGSSVITVEDGYVVSGSTESFSMNPDAADAWILKTDTLGNLLWSTTSGDGLPDYGYDLVKEDNGSFALTGYIWSYGANNANLTLMQVNSTGELQWFTEYGNWGSDERGFALCTTSDSGFAVTGWTDIRSHSFTVGLLRLGYTNNKIITTNYSNYNICNIIDDFSLFPPSPNPFNAETVISFDLPLAGDITLEAFNLTGRKIETIAAGEYPAGRHTATFAGENLPSGVYFLRLQAGGEVRTQKCVLLK